MLIGGGHILDPFSGSSIAGLVASKLGYNFIGTDTWKDQVEQNNSKAEELKEKNCKWYVDSGENIGKYTKGKKVDMIITDPPYFNLENYQEKNEKDISNTKDYKEFLENLRKVLAPTIDLLKNEGWAIIKAGNIRDENGAYYNFTGDIVRIMQDIGYSFWNEIILATPIASAAVRARNTFGKSKKVVKTHQNILFFNKGKEVKINKDLKEILLTGLTATAHHDILVFKK